MNQQSYITLVDQLFAIKRQPPSSPFSKGEFKEAGTSALEKQLDEMVKAGTQMLPLQDKFYILFPIGDALSSQLSWTHYRLMMRVENYTVERGVNAGTS